MQERHIIGETGNYSGGIDRMANFITIIAEMQQRLQEQQEEVRALRQQNQGSKGGVGGDGAPPIPPPTTRLIV